MRYNSDIHHRRSVRLKAHDYSLAGAYFVTICTQNRECVFGEIQKAEMILNNAGRMVQNVWDELPVRYPGVQIDSFIIMPNHIHGIILLTGSTQRRGESRIRPNQGDHKDRPYGTLAGTIGRVMQGFKSMTTRKYISGIRDNGWPPFEKRLWQRNYYERVVRDDSEMHRVREYITGNPAGWLEDEENPVRHS
ncbi:MAG: transposase [Nitrospirae bacterium]|nr:transposase [Nitrospirota bacterium]